MHKVMPRPDISPAVQPDPASFQEGGIRFLADEDKGARSFDLFDRARLPIFGGHPLEFPPGPIETDHIGLEAYLKLGVPQDLFLDHLRSF